MSSISFKMTKPSTQRILLTYPLEIPIFCIIDIKIYSVTGNSGLHYFDTGRIEKVRDLPKC